MLAKSEIRTPDPGHPGALSYRHEVLMVQEHMNQILSGTQTRVATGWHRRGEAGQRAGQFVGIGQSGGLALQESVGGREFVVTGSTAENGLEGGADEVGVRE